MRICTLLTILLFIPAIVGCLDSNELSSLQDYQKYYEETRWGHAHYCADFSTFRNYDIDTNSSSQAFLDSPAGVYMIYSEFRPAFGPKTNKGSADLQRIPNVAVPIFRVAPSSDGMVRVMGFVGGRGFTIQARPNGTNHTKALDEATKVAQTVYGQLSRQND